MRNFGNSLGWPGYSVSWEGFTTREDEVVCVGYRDFSRPANFSIERGWNGDDRWIKINGDRLDLIRGQCVLITNGKSGNRSGSGRRG